MKRQKKSVQGKQTVPTCLERSYMYQFLYTHCPGWFCDVRRQALPSRPSIRRHPWLSCLPDPDSTAVSPLALAPGLSRTRAIRCILQAAPVVWRGPDLSADKALPSRPTVCRYQPIVSPSRSLSPLSCGWTPFESPLFPDSRPQLVAHRLTLSMARTSAKRGSSGKGGLRGGRVQSSTRHSGYGCTYLPQCWLLRCCHDAQ